MRMAIGRRVEKLKPRGGHVGFEVGIADEENVLGSRIQRGRTGDVVAEKLLSGSGDNELVVGCAADVLRDEIAFAGGGEFQRGLVGDFVAGDDPAVLAAADGGLVPLELISGDDAVDRCDCQRRPSV